MVVLSRDRQVILGGERVPQKAEASASDFATLLSPSVQRKFLQAFDLAMLLRTPQKVEDVAVEGDVMVDLILVPTCSGSGYAPMCVVFFGGGCLPTEASMTPVVPVALTASPAPVTQVPGMVHRSNSFQESSDRASSGGSEPPSRVASVAENSEFSSGFQNLVQRVRSRPAEAEAAPPSTPPATGPLILPRDDSSGTSGISNPRDEGSSSGGRSARPSLSFTSSISSGLSLDSSDLRRRSFVPLVNREVQVDTQALRKAYVKEAETNTDIEWAKEGFRCTKCSRPPVRPGSVTAEAAASLLFEPPRGRKKKKEVAGFDGLWTIVKNDESRINSCFGRLCFRGRRCVDHEGNHWQITNVDGRVLLAGSELTCEGENLFHLKRPNGIRVSFTRGSGGRTIEGSSSNERPGSSRSEQSNGSPSEQQGYNIPSPLRATGVLVSESSGTSSPRTSGSSPHREGSLFAEIDFLAAPSNESISSVQSRPQFRRTLSAPADGHL